MGGVAAVGDWVAGTVVAVGACVGVAETVALGAGVEGLADNGVAVGSTGELQAKTASTTG